MICLIDCDTAYSRSPSKSFVNLKAENLLNTAETLINTADKHPFLLIFPLLYYGFYN